MVPRRDGAANGGEGGGGQSCPLAHFSLPLGSCRIFAAQSDGRLGEKALRVDAATKRAVVTSGTGDFQ